MWQEAGRELRSGRRMEEHTVEPRPKWYMPIAITALLWNLMGCMAYLSDVMMSPEAVAKLSAAEQAMYAARPAWSVGATAIAVWFGAAGSFGLILRKGWALPLLVASLLGVIVQDVSMFMMLGASQAGPVPMVLQGLVLGIAVALVLLARTASAKGWFGNASARRA